MLSDSVFKFQKRVADKDFFASLKKEFQLLDQFIKENEATFNDIADAIGGALAGAVKLLSGAIKAIAISVDGVTTAFDFLIETLNKLPLVNIQHITKEQRQLQRELMSYEDTIMRIVKLREEELKATIQTSLANKKTQEEAKKTFNIFESHHKLVKAVEDSEKRRTERIIGSSRNIFDEQQKIANLQKSDLTLKDKVLEKIKDQNKEFDLSNLIFENINLGVESMSRGIAESIVLGKSLKNTFSNMAKTLAVEVLTEVIRVVAQKGVELAIERLITKEKQKQAAISKASTFSKGFSLVTSFLGFADGGRPPVGRPSIIGEKGPELFQPDQAGTIIPNHQLGQLGMSKPVTVNFNINTVDARGFNELLVNSRGVIVNMINSAVNEKGKAALI